MERCISDVERGSEQVHGIDAESIGGALRRDRGVDQGRAVANSGDLAPADPARLEVVEEPNVALLGEVDVCFQPALEAARGESRCTG